eukprot:GHVS01070114.1.p1 GENE.GHVS01070114.1~~GHVS01070114.1.p1  ORF type:complete len:161 (+),score=23.38 GHVS01070114.1:242-724(+)
MSTREHPPPTSGQPLRPLRVFVCSFILLLLPVFVAAWKVTVTEPNEDPNLRAHIEVTVVSDLKGETAKLMVDENKGSSEVTKAVAPFSIHLELESVHLTGVAGKEKESNKSVDIQKVPTQVYAKYSTNNGENKLQSFLVMFQLNTAPASHNAVPPLMRCV